MRIIDVPAVDPEGFCSLVQLEFLHELEREIHNEAIAHFITHWQAASVGSQRKPGFAVRNHAAKLQDSLASLFDEVKLPVPIRDSRQEPPTQAIRRRQWR